MTEQELVAHLERQAKYDRNARVILQWRKAGLCTPEAREKRIQLWLQRTRATARREV